MIIGGGMTATAVVDSIREVDSTGEIGLISAELDPPYDRPPLSKALWKGTPLDSIWRKTENKGVTVQPGPPGLVKGLRTMLTEISVAVDDIRAEEFAGY